MKKTALLIATIALLAGCGSQSTHDGNDAAKPGAVVDETQHPTGVSNQNVISTDTAAMNVEAMSDTTAGQ